MNVLVEALGWSLATGREGLSGLPHDKNRPKWVCKGPIDLSTISNLSTSMLCIRKVRKKDEQEKHGACQPIESPPALLQEWQLQRSLVGGGRGPDETSGGFL